MTVKLHVLTKINLEFLSLKGGFTGWSESTLVKMPHCSNHMSSLFYGSCHPVAQNVCLCLSVYGINSQDPEIDYTVNPVKNRHSK